MNKTTEENVIDVQKLSGLTYSWQTWHHSHRLHRVFTYRNSRNLRKTDRKVWPAHQNPCIIADVLLLF